MMSVRDGSNSVVLILQSASPSVTLLLFSDCNYLVHIQASSKFASPQSFNHSTTPNSNPSVSLLFLKCIWYSSVNQTFIQLLLSAMPWLIISHVTFQSSENPSANMSLGSRLPDSFTPCHDVILSGVSTAPRTQKKQVRMTLQHFDQKQYTTSVCTWKKTSFFSPLLLDVRDWVRGAVLLKFGLSLPSVTARKTNIIRSV